MFSQGLDWFSAPCNNHKLTGDMLAALRKLHLPNVLTLGTMAFLLIWCLSPFTDLDFTWQIRTGEQIVRTGELRGVDEFSYTIKGRRVADFEWLYEVILYGLWTVTGAAGLKILKAILLAIPMILIAVHLQRQKVPDLFIFVCLASAALVLFPGWNLRAMSVTTIGILLTVMTLHDHCWAKRPLPWWLPMVYLLWANMHPGVIAGLGILFLAVCWVSLNQLARWTTTLPRSAWLRLMVISALCFLASLIAPDPLDRFLYPLNPDLRHPIMKIFTEMQPLASFVFDLPITVILSYLVMALVLLTLVWRTSQYRGWEILTLVALGCLANFSIRSLADWYYTMLLLGTAPLLSLLRIDHKLQKSNPLLKLQPRWLLASVAFVIAITILVAPYQPLIAETCACPESAVEFIESRQIEGTFFCSTTNGSYLGWRLKGRVQVYVDTRGFFFPPRLLEDSHQIPRMENQWLERLEEILSDRPPDFFLLENSGANGELWRNMPHDQMVVLFEDSQVGLIETEQMQKAVTILRQRKNADELTKGKIVEK